MRKNWLQTRVEQLRARLLRHIAKTALDDAIVEWQKTRDGQGTRAVGFVNYLLGTSGKIPHFGIPTIYEILLVGDYEEPLTNELRRQLNNYLTEKRLLPPLDIQGTVSAMSGYRWHAKLFKPKIHHRP